MSGTSKIHGRCLVPSRRLSTLTSTFATFAANVMVTNTLLGQ